MTVVDLVRQYLKVRTDISDADLWVLVQQMAESLGIDVNAIDDAYGQLIADEIDKAGVGLSVTENSSLSIVEEPKNGKKNKRNTPATTNNQGIEDLKPAVQNLKTAVAGEANAMVQVFDQKSSQVEDAVTARIMNRCKQINPNIIAKVSAELQGYTSESASFRGQIGSIFDEAFADIVNY